MKNDGSDRIVNLQDVDIDLVRDAGKWFRVKTDGTGIEAAAAEDFVATEPPDTVLTDDIVITGVGTISVENGFITAFTPEE